MKSVGEVMAIGRKFEEALQKALRMLDIGVVGLVGNPDLDFSNLDRELSEPTYQRIFAIPQALKEGYSVDRIHELSKIDKWFLHKISNLVQIEEDLRQQPGQRLQRPSVASQAKRIF